MSIKHKELEIDPENPFKNCKLDRYKYAAVLTSIIETYHDGFVLAINNRWGTGKTTFIKMWEQDLKRNHYKTIYFNAWENDFEDNPLVALMGELKTITKDTSKVHFKRALKNAATLSKHIIPLVAQAIADRYINTKLLNEAIVGVSEGVADIFESEVKDYEFKKDNVKEFRRNLSNFISETNEGKPIIFFIDELDRCRPNYAVSILEQIKHFFSVPNIVFVLSIDKVQLGNAVRGVYGNDKIDSDEYLRRFIDIEYSIPKPETGNYYKYLIDYFKFNQFFNSKARSGIYSFTSDWEKFLQTAKVLFQDTSLTLRQQEKLFAHARLALNSFQANSYVLPSVYLLLIFFRIANENFYYEIKSKKLCIKQLQEKFLETLQDRINEDYERGLVWLEASLLVYYNNFLNSGYNRDSLYKRDETGANKLLVKSIIKQKGDEEFLACLEHIERSGTGYSDIGPLLSRIDLTESINRI